MEMSKITLRRSGATAAPCNTTSLDRARMALSRDSAQRQSFLHARWQGRSENSTTDKKHQPNANDIDHWWEVRLQTPLGRALSQLAKV
jgi:hypothetical protein